MCFIYAQQNMIALQRNCRLTLIYRTVAASNKAPSALTVSLSRESTEGCPSWNSSR